MSHLTAWNTFVQTEARLRTQTAVALLAKPLAADPLGEPCKVIDMVSWARARGMHDRVADTATLVKMEHINKLSVGRERGYQAPAPIQFNWAS